MEIMATIKNNLTTVELPSKGLLYDTIPSEITMRGMGMGEEKMIYGSTNVNAVDRALRNCIVEPKNIDLGELLAADQHFLLMKLRVHTFGSDYHAMGKCTECGAKNEFEVDLDEMLINYLPETFTEPIEIPLVDSGDKLSVKLLRNADIDFVNRQAKKLAKTLKVPAGELEYTMRMARMITHINGEQVDPGNAQKYVESMSSRDSAYFWFLLDEVKVGYDTIVTVVCPECGEEFEFALPLNSEFFRPKFRK